MVVIADFVNADGTDCQYYLGIKSGGSWTFKSIVAGGDPFYASSYYYGGIAFARESHSGIRLYVSREASGTWYLERYDSSDGGDNWTATELVSSASDLIIRPYSPVGATADYPVIYQRGASYTNFNTYSLDTLVHEVA